MPKDRRPGARAGRGRRRIRTDGSPRLAAPGAPGNPSANWAILWSERRDGAKTRSCKLSTGTPDPRLAQDFLTRFLAARAQPKEAASINDVLDGYCAARADKYVEREVEAKRARIRLQNLDSLLKPIRAHFGALAPSKATPAYQRAYAQKRRAEPKRRGFGAGTDVVDIGGRPSERTISLELAALRAALKRAAEEGEIARAPKVSLPQSQPKARQRVLKRAEFVAFMRALFAPATPAHLRAFVKLGILTGQRSKAIKALRWDYIDWDEGVIRFTATDPNAAGNKRIADTPMTPDLARYLREVEAGAASPFVIEWKGRGVSSVKSAWRELLSRAGLTDVRIHDLRRAAATIAINEGADLASIGRLLADSEATTARNYAHADPSRILGVVALIEAHVQAAREEE